MNQSAKIPMAPKGWYSRGYLNHFDGGPIPQTVTFRLIDSFPSKKLEEWADELELLFDQFRETERRRRIEEYLDMGKGEAWLSRREIAELVQRALLYFAGNRYDLHAWVIMPNHVHALITLREFQALSQILHSWKSFTAKQANALLNRSGGFWQEEYFDRFIRDERHFEAEIAYIENNPIKAGLCEIPQDWHFSSARLRQEFT
jgi:putative DNA methylase